MSGVVQSGKGFCIRNVKVPLGKLSSETATTRINIAGRNWFHAVTV